MTQLPHSDTMTTSTSSSKLLVRPIHIYLGGSFDPVHNSHVDLLTHVYQSMVGINFNHYGNIPQPTPEFHPNQIQGVTSCFNVHAYFLPTSRSPLKQQSSHPQHRLNMLRLITDIPSLYPADLNQSVSLPQLADSFHSTEPDATSINSTVPDQCKLEVCEYELWQTPPTYTIDTLQALREHSPLASLIFVIGADNIASLSEWRDGNKLTEFAHLWVIPRNEHQTKADIVDLLPAMLQPKVTHSIFDLSNHPSGHIYIDSYTVPPLSSTYVRQAILQGNFDLAKSALPHPVYSYIMNNNLYQS